MIIDDTSKLTKGSTVKIKVKCEICDQIREIQYRHAVGSLKRNGKTLCKKCSQEIKRFKKGISRPKKKETTQKMIETKRRNGVFEDFKTRFLGAGNPNWKGGINDLLNTIRKSSKQTTWRESVFIRDKFTCVLCGYDKGHIIEADHIVPLSFLVKKFKIKTIEDAFICEALWDTQNGRTLCRFCHKQTDTWGKKAANFKG